MPALFSFLTKISLAATLSLTGLAFSGGVVIQMGSVVLGEGSDIRTLTGTAEVGVNNTNLTFTSWENFLNNNGIVVGYLKFDQGTPVDNCYGSGDCYAVRWNKKPGGNNGEGYLSGWARMEIGSNSPEMWVHFKAPADLNSYICSPDTIKKDQNYYVCSDSTGHLYGYAWSSGGNSVSVQDNPGLGWIDFSQVSIPFPNMPNPTPTPVNANVNTNINANININTNNNFQTQNILDQSCYVYLDSGAKTICNSSGSANFKAVTSGLDIRTYQWDCNSQNSPTVACNFSGYGEKMPHLNLVLADGGTFACQSMSTVLLTNETKCSLKAKNLNSNDNSSDNSNSLTINPGDTIQADVTGQCIDNLSANWTVKGLDKTPAGNLSIKATPQSGAVGGSIEASVTGTDGQPVNCGKVNVVIKEKVNWGN